MHTGEIRGCHLWGGLFWSGDLWYGDFWCGGQFRWGGWDDGGLLFRVDGTQGLQ